MSHALRLTTHITISVSDQIAIDPSFDPRVTSNIAAWVINSSDPLFDMAWVLAPSEGLNAAANLRSALLAASPRGVDSFTPPASQGAITYPIAFWTTISSPSPSCAFGVITDHTGIAEVSFFEQNATALANRDQCKNGGWRLFTDASGRTVFRNQGDCVSFVATGGRNPPRPRDDRGRDDRGR